MLRLPHSFCFNVILIKYNTLDAELSNPQFDKKTLLHKIGQSEGFLSRPLGPLLKTGLLLIGNMLKPLDKIVLISLGMTAATFINA